MLDVTHADAYRCRRSAGIAACVLPSRVPGGLARLPPHPTTAPNIFTTSPAPVDLPAPPSGDGSGSGPGACRQVGSAGLLGHGHHDRSSAHGAGRALSRTLPPASARPLRMRRSLLRLARPRVERQLPGTPFRVDGDRLSVLHLPLQQELA